MARAGRRPGPTSTPEEILTAARALFAEHGFRGTSVRAVASRAGVNPALVHHYFGTKEGLYLAALRMPINPIEVVDQLLAAGPREEFAERFVRFFIATWRAPETGQPLRALVRSAVGTDGGSDAVRTLAEDVLLEPVTAALGVPKLRVALAISHMLGIVIAATIVRVEPLASASDDELVALVAPVIARYI